MNELRYSKKCNVDVMVEMLHLDVLSDDFDSIETYEHKTGQDNIIIKLKRSFFSHEVDAITAIIQSYNNAHPLVIRKQLESKISVPAIVAGQSIVAKYAAMNLYAGKGALQIIEVMQLSSNLILFLLTGSLELARYELNIIKSSLPASGSITEAECLEFIRRLDIEIKKLKG